MSINTVSNQRILEISQKVVQAAKDTLGEKLDKVILYGSYARGNYDEESDVDYFILADVPQEETSMWRSAIREHIPYIDLEYDLLVSLHITRKAIFEQCVGFIPFFKNVTREGVLLYDYEN